MTSSMLRAGTVVAALAVTGGLVAGATLLPAAQTSPTPVEVRVGVNAICPVVDAKQAGVYTAVAAITDGVNVQALAGGAKRELATNSMIEITKPLGPMRLIVPAGGHGAGVSLTSEPAGLDAGIAASRCEDPSTATWFVGVPSSADRGTEIVLSNSDETPAEVDLTFYGAGGRLLVASGHSIIVRPDETSVVALEPIFTDPEPVTVVVRSPQGRVSAFARVQGRAKAGTTISTGVDWHAQAVAPRKDLVIPGVPGGGGSRRLLIANPSAKRATVQVQAMGRNGATKLVDAGSVPVRPESTVTLDISQALGDDVVALRLLSDVDVTATVLADNGTKAPDFGAAVAAPVFSGAALLPVSLHGKQATLSIASTSDKEGSVDVQFFSGNGIPVGKPAAVRIPAGGSAQVPVPSDGLVSARLQTPEGMSVAAAMVLTGPTGPLQGLAIVPFHPSSSSSQYTVPQQDARVGR